MFPFFIVLLISFFFVPLIIYEIAFNTNKNNETGDKDAFQK